MKDPNYSKRKHPGSDNRPFKRSKGGVKGKWTTPHHEAKLAMFRAKGLEAGDVGLSTTCVKGKERQALEELMDICEEYGATLYNLTPEDPAYSTDEDGNIEASIRKEVQGLPSALTRDPNAPFEPVRLDLDCLLFMRTRAPVDPVALAHRICVDARDDVDWKKGGRRARFLNRFTPVTASAKANEAGLEEVARKVLAEHFRLVGEKEKGEGEGEGDGDGDGEGGDGKKDEEAKGKAYSYAIRPTFRAHNVLKREDVIKKVANLIDTRHKVNLTSPDKVILIDIYQSFCGMSVVDGDWDSLKRYNLHEILVAALKAKGQPVKEEKGKAEKAQTDKPET